MQLNNIKKSYLNVDEILEIAWKVFQSNWKIFLSFVLLIALPFNFFNHLIQSGKISTNSSNALLFIILLSINVVTLLSTIIFTERTIFNNSIEVGIAFQKSIKKLFFVFLFNLMAFLPILIASFFFLIPGIYLTVKLIFINQAIILRNTYDPFSYSSKLVEGKWWKVFGNILFFIFIFLVIIVPIILLEFIIMTFISGVLMNDVVSFYDLSSFVTIINNTISSSLYYFFIIYLTTLFINLDYVKNSTIFQK